MERRFNIIQGEYQHEEKRILPRFPFGTLIFKSQNEKKSKAYEVRDITYRGMQIHLPNGASEYEENSKMEGIIHGLGHKMVLSGRIAWKKENVLGVEFTEKKLQKKLEEFFSLKNLANALRPLHKGPMDLELPPHLKYWLQANNTLEIFVWGHNHGEYAQFQIIKLDTFVEWEDGPGLSTGTLAGRRDIETPLTFEDEFLFHFHESPNTKQVKEALELVSLISEDLLSTEALSFMKMKLLG